MILYTACHEISHVHHLKIIKENKDYYSSSLELEYKSLIIFQYYVPKLYKSKHDSFHIEHLASIDGLSLLKEKLNSTLKNKYDYIYNGLLDMLIKQEDQQYYQIIDGIKTIDPRSVITNVLLKSISDEENKHALRKSFLNLRKYYNDENGVEFITNKNFTHDELKQIFFNIYGYYLITNEYVDASHQYIVNDIKKYDVEQLIYKYRSLAYKKMLQRLFVNVATFTRIEKLELIRAFENERSTLLPLLTNEELTSRNNGHISNYDDIVIIVKEINYLLDKDLLFYSPLFSQVADFINKMDPIILDKILRIFTTDKFIDLKRNFKGSNYMFSTEFGKQLSDYLLQYDEYISDLETNINLERKRIYG